MKNLKIYGLFRYELFCGEFNDRHLQAGSIEIDPDWSDARILRAVKKEWGPFSGLKISDLSDDTVLYLENRKGEPIGELVPAEDICQPWSR